MLQHSDFDDFIALVRRVECETTRGPDAHPDTVLRAEAQSDRVLHRNECARLQGSLRIASIAEDSSESPHQILDAIVEDLSAEDRRYLPLSHHEEWISAIRWGSSPVGGEILR